jgi:hypothetical protein
MAGDALTTNPAAPSPSIPIHLRHAPLGKAHVVPAAAGLSFPDAWRSGRGGILRGGGASRRRSAWPGATVADVLRQGWLLTDGGGDRWWRSGLLLPVAAMVV